jgi:peptidoglycan/LPS O-acetylase OafA/YrhL
MTPEGAEGLPRKRDLDGLRGVAVLLTIFLHYVCRSGFFTSLGPRRLALLLDSSWSGVDIFFVLSGFLIGGITIDHGHAENFFRVFYLRRALRILPLAILTIAFSYLILPLLNPSILWGAQVPPYAYLLFINNIWTSLGRSPYIPLGSMWSLAIEEQFYLIAPVLLKSVGPRTRNLTLLAVMIISPLLRIGNLGPSSWDFTFFRLDGLATGILIAGLLREPRSREFAVRNRGSINAVVIGLVGVTLLFSSAPQYSDLQRVAFGVSLNSLAAGGVILSLQIAPRSWVSKSLSQSWLVTTGRYSYFLYLMHIPILSYTMAAYIIRPSVLYLVIALGSTFAGAWVSWRFLESKLVLLGKQYSYTAPSVGSVTPLRRSA